MLKYLKESMGKTQENHGNSEEQDENIKKDKSI